MQEWDEGEKGFKNGGGRVLVRFQVGKRGYSHQNKLKVYAL